MNCKFCNKHYKSNAWLITHEMNCKSKDISSESTDDESLNTSTDLFDNAFINDNVNDSIDIYDDLSPFDDIKDYYKSKPNHRLNNMRFALLNINSVRSKLDDLYESCKLDLFQIILIQESKLDSSVPDEHVAFFDY